MINEDAFGAAHTSAVSMFDCPSQGGNRHTLQSGGIFTRVVVPDEKGVLCGNGWANGVPSMTNRDLATVMGAWQAISTSILSSANSSYCVRIKSFIYSICFEFFNSRTLEYGINEQRRNNPRKEKIGRFICAITLSCFASPGNNMQANVYVRLQRQQICHAK